MKYIFIRGSPSFSQCRSFNQIISISDLPLSLKVLKAKANRYLIINKPLDFVHSCIQCLAFLFRLTDIEGFRYLHKLEHLDVCDNALETFDGMYVNEL